MTSFGVSYIGGQTLSVTNPDGGTSITVNNQDGTLSSVTGTAVAPFRKVYGVATDASISRAYVADIKLNSSFADTSETQTNFADMLGRDYKTTYAAASAPYPSATTGFNVRGQMSSQVDPDGVTMLYLYNQRGDMEYSVLDSNRNSSVDWSGSDRITFTTNDVFQISGIWDTAVIQRSRTYVWTETGSVLARESWSTTNGIRRADIAFGLTNEVRTVYAGSGFRYVTNTTPDGTLLIATYVNGRLTLSSNWNSSVPNLGSKSYGYDEWGRQDSITDARNGKTTLIYNAADVVATNTTPSPDGVQPGQMTISAWNKSLQTTNTTFADGLSLTNFFNPAGDTRLSDGARTYPSGFGFDAQRRGTALTNWSAFPSAGARLTSWTYDSYRGWLNSKTYDGGNAGPAYTHSPGGKVASRVWARGIGTTNVYNNAGELSAVNYSGSTSNLTLCSDRRERLTASVQGSATTSRSYDDAGNMLAESYSGGPLSGISVNSGFDQFLRRTNLNVKLGGSTLVQQGFGFDAPSRLRSVTNGTLTASYAYLANSPLVSQISFTNSGVQRMVTTKQFDFLDRLQSVASSSSSNIASFAYRYNLASQRTAVTNLDGSYWIYAYDFLGQLTSAKKYWSDGWPIAGQQFLYAYDEIGNRTIVATGGDQWGANLRYGTYSANSRNQYTSRYNPGFAQVLGTVGSNATVSISGNNSAFANVSRHGDYFRGEITVNNASSPVWLTITNLAFVRNGGSPEYAATNIGNLFEPPASETFGHDADGNLTNNSQFVIAWDAENRPISFTSVPGSPTATQKKIEYKYDSAWRRIEKVISTNSGASYFPQCTNRFVYDAWNLIAILNETNGLLCSFTWGPDASGNTRGVGGVPGLLSMTVHVGSNAGTYFYVYDGNFNVVALVNAADGSVAAQYEYGPFGELLRATGSLAEINPFLFSTKFYDWETSLSYFGFRYYSASTGRWLSRDPIAEFGGFNVYAHSRNMQPNKTDHLGLFDGTGIGGPPWPGLPEWQPQKRPCTMAFNFDDDEAWYESFAQPGVTTWLTKMDEIRKSIEAQMKMCCCIQQIFFTTHSGVPGVLMLGDGLVSGTMLVQAINEPNPKRREQLENAHNKEREFLTYVKGKMCKSAKIVFVECSVDQGPEGEALKNWLGAIFGKEVSVTLYNGSVKWFYGKPKCKVRN